ncbi:hypothetical protein M514_05550 [Trichuris suis]|uniref:GIY-YIG domain-containing protein n=1 Tax=Trichuris suis TaxID=68888 RepID=A0A085M8T8_9BILA|nr:hypothetical protein M513_05550 [Trichuris suis]KFD62627.1 hypothetical protein M514_05550 [Trichuris suis]
MVSAFSSCYTPNLRPLLRNDKTKVPFEERPGIVYDIKCGCNASYIGETGNTTRQVQRAHEGTQRQEDSEGRPQRDAEETLRPTFNAATITGHGEGKEQFCGLSVHLTYIEKYFVVRGSFALDK